MSTVVGSVESRTGEVLAPLIYHSWSLINPVTPTMEDIQQQYNDRFM